MRTRNFMSTAIAIAAPDEDFYETNVGSVEGQSMQTDRSV